MTAKGVVLFIVAMAGAFLVGTAIGLLAEWVGGYII